MINTRIGDEVVVTTHPRRNGDFRKEVKTDIPQDFR
jgi:hypothetical protein